MTIEFFNKIIAIVFIVCYAYQIAYLFIPLFIINRTRVIDDKLNKYAILIAARNEEKVIANLIDSLNNQSYPSKYFDIYVCADNCNDQTYDIAKEKGAYAYKRFNNDKVGKGYVLDFLLRKISKTDKKYDAYIVFDADNVVDKDFIKEINLVFNEGYDVLTSYRNSKNYGDNWISAGYGLWYLHESSHLNASRMIIGSSCSINGTGFLVSDKLLKEIGGWKYFLLTEDIEFSIDCVVNDIRIGYADKAIVYDEQPTDFKQSFNQRLRWSKGYLQVFHKSGLKLFEKMILGDFSSYDMMMNYAPVAILTFASLVVNMLNLYHDFLISGAYTYLFVEIFKMIFRMYVPLLIISLFTTIKEWKNIYCDKFKKIIYIFTCPLFMMTYLPICLVALFKKVNWTPIVHTRTLDLREIKRI